jgi:hypothetical protein
LVVRSLQPNRELWRKSEGGREGEEMNKEGGKEGRGRRGVLLTLNK